MKGSKTIKKTRFTEQQIAYALRQAESGVPLEKILRKMGVTQATFYRWKKKFAGMGIAELRRPTKPGMEGPHRC